MTVEQIKQEICEVGHRLYAHGFVAANDGNISVKVGENEFSFSGLKTAVIHHPQSCQRKGHPYHRYQSRTGCHRRYRAL